MKLNNPTLVCIVYRGQQAESTSGSQPPMPGGHSHLSLDDILQHAAEDIMNSIREQLDDDNETQRPNPRSFSTTKTGFQKSVRQLRKRIISQQR